MAKTGWNNLLAGINRAMECAMRLSDSDDAGKNFIFELGVTSALSPSIVKIMKIMTRSDKHAL